jgi:hypothetical protein
MKPNYSNSNHIDFLKNWGTVPPNKSNGFPWGPVIFAFLGGIAAAGIYNQFRYKPPVAKMENALP